MRFRIQKGLSSFFLGFLLTMLVTACGTVQEVNPVGTIQSKVGPTPTLICEPYEPSIVCEDRATAQKITPPPPPTLSAEFLTSEAKYLQLLTQLPPAVQPPVTTPTPSYITLPAADAGSIVFRGRSDYQEYPLFEIVYAEAVWRLEDTGDYLALVHNKIEGCRLHLAGVAMGMAEMPTIAQQELAGYLVEVREFRQTGLASYVFIMDKNYYLFGLVWPPDAARSIVDECRSAGEVVLNSFRLVQE